MFIIMQRWICLIKMRFHFYCCSIANVLIFRLFYNKGHDTNTQSVASFGGVWLMWNGKVKYSIMAKVRITSLLIPKFLLHSVLVLFLKQWRDIVEIFKAILFGRQVWENPRAFVYISEVFDLNGKVFFGEWYC